MRVPDWWTFVLLVLGVFRIVRILGWDDITTGLRARFLMPDAEYWIVAKWIDEMESSGFDPWTSSVPQRVSRPRFYIAKMAHCPWCSSFWWGIVAYAAWLAAGRVTLYVLTPLAVSSVVGLVAKNGDP